VIQPKNSIAYGLFRLLNTPDNPVSLYPHPDYHFGSALAAASCRTQNIYLER